MCNVASMSAGGPRGRNGRRGGGVWNVCLGNELVVACGVDFEAPHRDTSKKRNYSEGGLFFSRLNKLS